MTTEKFKRLTKGPTQRNGQLARTTLCGDTTDSYKYLSLYYSYFICIWPVQKLQLGSFPSARFVLSCKHASASSGLPVCPTSAGIQAGILQPTLSSGSLGIPRVYTR